MVHDGGGAAASSSNSVHGNVRLPTRSRSPISLHRAQPQVSISTVEAHSDALERLEEDAALIHEHLQADGEDFGRDKEVQLPAPQPVLTAKSADEPLIQAGISDYTFIPTDKGGLLGAGKFSSVQLAWKDGKKYAVKITPLFPHHNLIATRLLREPTILAQLPLHPNLVKVYESIRTAGHFYLVEEFLDGYTSLEAFVTSQPDHKLSLEQSTYIFEQLVSVVRSALHKPIQIAHRDIKPENILVHPETLHVILLDFGLATHFSSREPKLTTCCGSPAFHAPELFLSLKSPPGSVRYWGPEVDIWTIGVTMLRCLTGTKYPLGVQHTSLQHMADKTIDVLLSIEHKEFRRTLAGLLDMDGGKRMENFRALPVEIDQMPFKTSAARAKVAQREFKSTSFLVSEPKHLLPLPLLSPSVLSPSSMPTTPALGPRSRSVSRDRLAAHFSAGLELSEKPPSPPLSIISAVPELFLLNPTREPPMRAISFVKYALRCAGILYHIQPTSQDLRHDLPTAERPEFTLCTPILHCVLQFPKDVASVSAAATLLTQLRPPMLRAQTARSASTPPARQKSTAQTKKTELPTVRLREFWIQVIPVFSTKVQRLRRPQVRKNHSKSRQSFKVNDEDRECVKIRIRVSDDQAMDALRKVLSVGKLAGDPDADNLPKVEEEDEESSRGRPKMGRSLSSGRSDTAGGHPISRAVTEGTTTSAGARQVLDNVLTPAATPLPANETRQKKGFFDFVQFTTKRSASAGNTPLPSPDVQESRRPSREASPGPLAFAVM